jgi:predicted amidophosphoribosyltransferase
MFGAWVIFSAGVLLVIGVIYTAKTCPHCMKRIDRHARKCPHCCSELALRAVRR